MLTRRHQIAAKIEANEGTAETLVAADAKILAYSPKISFDPGMFERDPVRDSFSQIGKVVGKRPGSASFKLELRGSGAATTAPEWAKFLQACGFEVNALKKITIGAVTGGPFLHGEEITGGTSGGKGRVVIQTPNGQTTLYYVVVSGNLQNGETITGGTSTASAVAGSAPSDAGKEMRLITTGVPSLTIGSYEDGVHKILKGSRGKVKFGFKSGEPGMMDFDYRGVEGGVADLALLAGIAHETTKPPAFLSAQLLIDAYAAKVGEIDIDIANTLSERDDVNADRGLLSFSLTDRKVSGAINPEMVAVSAYDFYGKWFAGIEAVLDFTLGSVSGNKFRFYGPKLQYTKIDDEDRGGIKIAKGSFDLNATVTPGNDELVILAL